MTMRSKHFIAAMFLACACAVQAASVGEVFEAHRTGILSERFTRFDGMLFCKASVQAVSNNSSSRQAAQEKAALKASADLLAYATIEKIAWPAALNEGERTALIDWLTRQMNVSATIRGLTTPWSGREDGSNIYSAVVGIEEAALAGISRMDFTSARQKLLAEPSLLAPGAPVEALIALRATLGPIPVAVDRTPWNEVLNQARFSTARLAALPRLAGRYPLGSVANVAQDPDYRAGESAYNQNRLEKAYRHFLACAERTMTFDALNMAGAAARHLGRHAEASVLLLHAAYLNSASPWPWVHLAYIARTLGNETLCRACCANAEAATGYASDAWSQKNVAALRMPVIEKAEPLVSPEVSTPATANPPVESNMEPDITPAVQGVRSIVINADADGLGI